MSARVWQDRRAKNRPQSLGYWLAFDEGPWQRAVTEPERPIIRARRLRLQRLQRRILRRTYTERRVGGVIIAGTDAFAVAFIADSLRPRAAEFAAFMDVAIRDMMLHGSTFVPTWNVPERSYEELMAEMDHLISGKDAYSWSADDEVFSG